MKKRKEFSATNWLVALAAMALAMTATTVAVIHLQGFWKMAADAAIIGTMFAFMRASPMFLPFTKWVIITCFIVLGSPGPGILIALLELFASGALLAEAALTRIICRDAVSPP